MAIQQISVFLANKPGSLDRLTHALSDGGVDLRAISVSEAADYGIARLLADDPDKAAAALNGADFIFTRSPVLVCPVPDVAGGLSKLLVLLTETGINIEYMYSCTVGQNAKTAYMIFRVADPEIGRASCRERV